jgi:hypothetical protein
MLRNRLSGCRFRLQSKDREMGMNMFLITMSGELLFGQRDFLGAMIPVSAKSAPLRV